jgi:hypothetical protein
MNMLQVIQRGAQDAARRERPQPCPFCGADSPLAARIAGKFLVGCESEHCAANPQVSGATLVDAWASWNTRAPA